MISSLDEDNRRTVHRTEGGVAFCNNEGRYCYVICYVLITPMACISLSNISCLL